MFYLILFIAAIVIGPWLILSPIGLSAWSPIFQNDLLRLAAFAVVAVLGGVLLRAWDHRRMRQRLAGWWECLGVSSLLAACAYVAVSYLPEISSYPLTLTWSEASRYYYASLFFARRIYGVYAPPTVLHPSRYLMQAVPFLIPHSPLWLHRAWQVFLWLVMPSLTAYVLARRLPLEGRWRKLAFCAAVFLFLMIGPIYYHLLVPVVLVLWGFHVRPGVHPVGEGEVSRGGVIRNFVSSALVVLLASAWAGISRINWFPMPGVLAVTLILLETPLPSAFNAARGPAAWRAAFQYFARLAVWVLGGFGVALAAQAAYIAWSGNAAEQFTSSFTSDLLWSRLLPNPTYPPGIFLAIAVVSLPLFLLIFSRLVELRAGVPGFRRYHPLRLVALAAILVVFFAGGLVVSVKIGGGSNIHNMDAYIVLAVVIAAYFYTGAVAEDELPISTLPARSQSASGSSLRLFGLALAVIVPVAFAVFFRAPASPAPDRQQAQDAIETIAYYAEAVSQRSGEVLFISNRHLLTFGNVQGVQLIPEYERVFLMEMAMARDPIAMGRFHQDLKDQRYALIISEPLSRQQKGAEEIFGAENDVWVKQVARYILCYYEPEKTLRLAQVQLLIPKAVPASDCP